MFDFQTKIKRQIQILGLCTSSKYTIGDLAALFNVEELTIKRDLQELRSEGIMIHSKKKEGICLDNPVDKTKLKEIILHFIGLNFTEQSVDRSTSILVEKYNSKALENIVLLQLCIDKTQIARIKYWNESETEFKEREIKPLLIFQNDGAWRVLSQDGDIVKQFLLEKIEDVKCTERSFKRISKTKFEDLFRYSWKSWIGNERYKIKLHISKMWADRIKPRTLIFNQKITEQTDGSVMFEAEVNSFDEICSWIVSRGEGIKVLEPKELKDAVKKIAKNVLKNYE